MRERPLRLLLFVDPELPSSMRLLAASLSAAAAREDVAITAIVDTARQRAPTLRVPRALARWGLRRAFNLTTAAQPADPVAPFGCRALARRRHVPLLAPGERGVNDPGFVEQIRHLQPDATITLMVSQIFRAPLLSACSVPLNYHNGLLPQYRGVAATAWSIYERAPHSGFSFHRMTEAVDHGPILLQGAVPVGAGARAASVERAKTRLACSYLSRLFDLLRAPAQPWVEQSGGGSSFSRADERTITTVAEPQKLSLEELQLRLRAFERLRVTLSGEDLNVTALRRLARRPRHPGLAFATADGVRVEVSRVDHLPPAVRRISPGSHRAALARGRWKP